MKHANFTTPVGKLLQQKVRKTAHSTVGKSALRNDYIYCCNNGCRGHRKSLHDLTCTFILTAFLDSSRIELNGWSITVMGVATRYAVGGLGHRQ